MDGSVTLLQGSTLEKGVVVMLNKRPRGTMPKIEKKSVYVGLTRVRVTHGEIITATNTYVFTRQISQFVIKVTKTSAPCQCQWMITTSNISQVSDNVRNYS